MKKKVFLVKHEVFIRQYIRTGGHVANSNSMYIPKPIHTTKKGLTVRMYKTPSACQTHKSTPPKVTLPTINIVDPVFVNPCHLPLFKKYFVPLVMTFSI